MVDLPRRRSQPTQVPSGTMAAAAEGAPPSPATSFRFGERYTLDLVRGCLRDRGHEVKLRRKTFDVLTCFVTNAGRLLSKAELMRAAWAGVFVSDDSLTQCVREIRRAIGDIRHEWIRTSPGRGYLFDLPVVAAAAAPRGLARDPRELIARLRTLCLDPRHRDVPQQARDEWRTIALELDDQLIPALTGLAAAYAVEILSGWLPLSDRAACLARVDEATRRLLGLEPGEIEPCQS